MKKTLSVLIAVSALALTGCATTTQPVPTVTVTVTESATPTPVPTVTKTQALPDQVFLDLVRKAHPVLGGISDKQLLDLADSTCRAFARGATKQEIVSTVEDSPMSVSLKYGMVYTMGAGVQLYCPEYSGLLG